MAIGSSMKEDLEEERKNIMMIVQYFMTSSMKEDLKSDEEYETDITIGSSMKEDLGLVKKKR